MLKKRDYYIYIPQTNKSLSELPVYIILHGGFSNAREIMQESRFNSLADELKMIVVYPNAAYGIFGKFQHWNAGFCCGKAQKDNLDDIGFILDIVKDVRKQYSLVNNNIYLIGFSNGGMLAYNFAAVYGDILNGLAIVSATVGSRLSQEQEFEMIPTPKSKLPIIIFHGKSDKSIPYEGGQTLHHKTKREYMSVEDSLASWKSVNGCIKEEATQISNKIELYRCYDENSNVMCKLYSIEGLGHQWPYINEKFDASKLIYDFFE